MTGGQKVVMAIVILLILSVILRIVAIRNIAKIAIANDMKYDKEVADIKEKMAKK